MKNGPASKIAKLKNPLRVDCYVSGRWLRFNRYSGSGPDGELIAFDVMTADWDERAKKLSTFVAYRKDLIAILKIVGPNKDVAESKKGKVQTFHAKN